MDSVSNKCILNCFLIIRTSFWEPTIDFNPQKAKMDAEVERVRLISVSDGLKPTGVVLLVPSELATANS